MEGLLASHFACGGQQHTTIRVCQYELWGQNNVAVPNTGGASEVGQATRLGVLNGDGNFFFREFFFGTRTAEQRCFGASGQGESCADSVFIESFLLDYNTTPGHVPTSLLGIDFLHLVLQQWRLPHRS